MCMVTRHLSAIVGLGALIGSAWLTMPAPASATPTEPAVEAVCAAAAPGYAECLLLRRTDLGVQPATAMSPLWTPSGYGPADLRSAYSLPSGSEGTGLTVAVVDAYDLPTAEADLAAYRAQYGLPPCTTANGCFRKVDQNGGTAYPAPNAAWGQEIALDIDMVSATCPNCNILLVEATNNSMLNLGTAVNTAAALGAVAVSNSYGGPESSGIGFYDSYFNHPGVAVTASTGDCGYGCSANNQLGVEYPAASPYVIAVGGTSLSRDSSARGWTESAWRGAGSGCSAYEPKPTWQTDAGCPNRTEADVSAVADPATGVAFYVGGSWGIAGGTSASAPIVASIYALAGGPAAGTYPASYPYASTANLYDVIGGNNDITFHTCTLTYLCNGVAGYDGPTGLGTPHGVAAFVPQISTTPGTYHPVPPTRLLDTRSGNGLTGKLYANTPRTFQITGRAPIPADATAVTANVTVVNPTFDWAVFLGPNPIASPTSSTINFKTGQVTSNGLTVALSATGSLSATYMSTTGNTTDLVFDVTGYFTPDATGATYHPMPPSRLLDTRTGNGSAGKLLANTPKTFQVTGRSSIPSGATGVTGNVTVVNSTNAWAIFLGPDPIESPTTSTLNFTTGQIKSNGLTVALSATGSLSATYMSTTGNTTDLVFDVTGYFTPDATGTRYVPLSPARLLDSRIGTGFRGTLAASTPRTFYVAGRRGVPTTATGVTGNITAVNSTNAWAAFLGPDPIASPGTSTVNFLTGEITGNGLTVALGSDGSLSATYMSTTGNATDLVFDVSGYFVP